MGKSKLKTAVLGLNDRTELLLEAASEIDYFQIQAVADKETKLAEKVALRYNCAAYDDYRQLIMQNQLDCLLVAAGMYSCDEYIRMAMKKKFKILKLAPPARNFEEAAEFVRLAKDEDIKFGISLGAAILFYAGNIYGGVNAVRNHNYYENEKYLEKIIMNVINESELDE